jgi:hypothetical protein
MEQGPAFPITKRNRRASFQEKRHHLHMPGFAGVKQRRLRVLVLGARVCSRHQEPADRLGTPVVRSDMEGAVAVLIQRVDIHLCQRGGKQGFSPA